MVYVFGNPVYGKRPAPGCSCSGQHYFGCGYTGPYVYNALLASTGSPAFGTVPDPSVKRASETHPGKKHVCIGFRCAHILTLLLGFGFRCAHMLTLLFIVQDVEASS